MYHRFGNFQGTIFSLISKKLYYKAISSLYRIRVKFGGDKKLTVWRSDLEPPIIMSANYFNLGGGADHSSW